MVVGLCTVELFISGSQSLKDKRQVFMGSKTGFGASLTFQLPKWMDRTSGRKPSLEWLVYRMKRSHVNQVLEQALNVIKSMPAVEVVEQNTLAEAKDFTNAFARLPRKPVSRLLRLPEFSNHEGCGVVNTDPAGQRTDVGTRFEAYKRADRVADQIRMEVADILMRKIKDPRVHDVTVTDVELTGGFAHRPYFCHDHGNG